MKFFQYPFCNKVIKNICWHHDAFINLWGTRVMYCYVVKLPVFSLQWAKSPLAPSPSLVQLTIGAIVMKSFLRKADFSLLSDVNEFVLGNQWNVVKDSVDQLKIAQPGQCELLAKSNLHCIGPQCHEKFQSALQSTIKVRSA